MYEKLNLNLHSSLSAYHCVQLSYTTQHKTVLIMFPVILQTVITVQMMPTGGQGAFTHMMLRLCLTCVGVSLFYSHTVVIFDEQY